MNLGGESRPAASDSDGRPGSGTVIPESACDLCGAREADLVASVDRDGCPLRSVICRRCGLVWTDPVPDEEVLREFYEGTYRWEYKGVNKPTPRHIYRGGLLAAERIRHIRELAEPGSVIVDVGSGCGEFVYLLRQLGFDAQGVQPPDGYARYSREELGIPVHIGFARDIGLPQSSCQVVTLFHSLEHMSFPPRVLEHVRDWLRPRGWLVVEVPNIEAVCHAPSHRFHRAHLFGFNVATLRRIGERAGFEVDSEHESASGENISVIFRRSDANRLLAGTIPGNCERIKRTIRDHTPLRHYTSIHPYVRPLARLVRTTRERSAVKAIGGAGKDLLDAIRTRKLQSRHPACSP